MWLRNMAKSIDERLILLLGTVKSGLALAKLRKDFFTFIISPVTVLEDDKVCEKKRDPFLTFSYK